MIERDPIQSDEPRPRRSGGSDSRRRSRVEPRRGARRTERPTRTRAASAEAGKASRVRRTSRAGLPSALEGESGLPVRRGRKRGGCGRAAVGILVLLLLVAAIGAAGAWYLTRPQPAENTTSGEPVHVLIESGATTSEIAAQLEELGVIDNAFSFRLKTKSAQADGQLRAGEYDMTTGMSYEDVIAMLKKGPVLTYYTVPIPEGFTAKQIAARFAERAKIPADELLALMTTGAEQFAAGHPYLAGAYGGSLEGFLFPATYEVEEGTTATEVVELMLDAFDENAAKLDMGFATSRGLDLGDVVIIASILEREAQLSEEFPLVSSVIYNRLAKPMRLQLCATVMYTMPEGTTSLTNDDLEEDSPYNTYLHDGLPVGPISNPGLAALTAAASPAETNYLYYVLTGTDGSQTFCATYDEFLRAKQKNKQVFGN